MRTVVIGTKRVDLNRFFTVVFGAVAIVVLAWFFASWLNVILTNDNAETSGQLANWNFFKVAVLNYLK